MDTFRGDSSTGPAHVTALLRHFADLRDGTHGQLHSRGDKERLFAQAVQLLDPFARQALDEINTALLLETGTVEASGVTQSNQHGPAATWKLSWPEQQAAQIAPITIHAFYGRTFHHPHVRGGTNGEWPLNVFTAEDAAAELPTLRTIAAGDLHNLVFKRDYRIIPAITGKSEGSPEHLSDRHL